VAKSELSLLSRLPRAGSEKKEEKVKEKNPGGGWTTVRCRVSGTKRQEEGEKTRAARAVAGMRLRCVERKSGKREQGKGESRLRNPVMMAAGGDWQLGRVIARQNGKEVRVEGETEGVGEGRWRTLKRFAYK